MYETVFVIWHRKHNFSFEKLVSFNGLHGVTPQTTTVVFLLTAMRSSSLTCFKEVCGTYHINSGKLGVLKQGFWTSLINPGNIVSGNNHKLGKVGHVEICFWATRRAALSSGQVCSTKQANSPTGHPPRDCCYHILWCNLFLPFAIVNVNFVIVFMARCWIN